MIPWLGALWEDCSGHVGEKFLPRDVYRQDTDIELTL